MPQLKRLLSPFQSFVRSESAGGILLMVAAAAAFAWANSPWAEAYEALKSTYFTVELGGEGLSKPLILWVNDGLMALFFLLVGLEIKRELLVGELNNRKAAALPIFAAVGGMVVPAGIYVLIQRGGPGIDGWGVPMATDIAFALGILSLLGPRVPIALKVFLTAVAIVDDLGAVLVIALFYTADLSLGALAASILAWAAALFYGMRGGRKLPVFLLIGVVVWFFMLKSGVHATVAGVLLAFTIPLRRDLEPRDLREELGRLFRDRDFERQEVEVEHLETLVHRAHSPLHNLEHALLPWSAFFIMPVFALFNAGFTLSPDASLTAPIALGAFLGLLVGKPIGVVLFSWLAVASGRAVLPANVGWGAVGGAGLLAGIGFTMSLFIGALAFTEAPELLDQIKMGVLSASVVAAVLGFVVLRLQTQTTSQTT